MTAVRAGAAAAAALAIALCALATGCGQTVKTRTVAYTIPTPTPTQTPQPPPPARRLPAIEVTGGGPLSGDPAAAARIKAQFPIVPGDHTASDTEALSYVKQLIAFAPELAPELGTLTTVSDCAIDYGVVGAQAYVTPDYSQAGAIIAVSRGQAQQLPTIALKCFARKVVGGGGPTDGGGFHPCFASYSIDDAVNGVADRYYIFAAGTNDAWCTLVRDFHRNFNEQPIG